MKTLEDYPEFDSGFRKLKDWKGNLVKVGDTVRLVEVYQGECIVGIGDGKFRTVMEEKNYLWNPSTPICVDSDGVIHELLRATWHFSAPIICIEGKSFDRDEYYLEKFKVK